MKKLILQICLASVMMALASCGGGTEKKTTEQEPVAEPQETVEGYITSMDLSSYQGVSEYCVGLDNGKDYCIPHDLLGGNGNEFRIFINPEVKDILDPTKEGEKRLNTSYIGKKVKITYKKNNVITNMIVTGEQKPPSETSMTYNGTLKEISQDSDGYPRLGFASDKGEEKKLRFNEDNENHYSLTSVYNGRNKKEDCIFQTKNYQLVLIPGVEAKPVTVQVEYKLIETKKQGTIRYLYDYVVRDVLLGNGAIELPKEQQD